MSEALQMIVIAVAEFTAQADTAATEETSQLTQIIERAIQIPGVEVGIAAVGIFVAVVAAVASHIVNLEKIFSSINKIAKYISRRDTELSEKQLANLRKQLLQQIKTDVAGRLEDSLHSLVRVDLEQEEQRHQVGRRKAPLVEVERKKKQPFTNLIQRGLSVFKQDQAIEPVAPAEETYNIFHRADIGGRLLILGEPGAGKTTELLTVAQRLIDEAISDSSKPIPVIFELSSWKEKTPIPTWIEQRFNQTYRIYKKRAKALARQGIQQNLLLPLLDGLDELGQSDQISCIEALEAFLSQHPAMPAIICCRREEYEQGKKQLKQLKGAIYLQSVTTEQIEQYLKRLNREVLWKEIKASPDMLDIATSPLFLTMLVVAYQGQPIRDKKTLFNAYLQKQLSNPKNKGAYKPSRHMTPEQTLHYLRWLAKRLAIEGEAEFLIEDIQPTWLVPENELRWLASSYLGFNVGIDSKWVRVYASILGLMVGLLTFLLVWIGGSPLQGLIFGLLWGCMTGLMSTIRFTINPVEKFNWSFRKGMILGVGSGLLLWLLSGLWYGLIFGLMVGFISAVFKTAEGQLELNTGTVKRKQVPNQGIRKSLQNGLIFALLVGGLFTIEAVVLPAVLGDDIRGGLLSQVDRWWEPLDGESEKDISMWRQLISLSFFGMLVGAPLGLIAATQHLALRIVLYVSGSAPWDLELFLEHAINHRFIQRTGGRYRFIHNLLRKHFANMSSREKEQIALAAEISSSE